MARRVAKCGTLAGFNRHKRTLKEEPCQACKDAENALQRRLRVARPEKRYCACGREIRTGHDACSECRALEGRIPCRLCGKHTRAEFCSACISDPTEDRHMPTGWVRERPGGPLVGVRTAHNSDINCTAHDHCDARRQAA